MNFNTAEKIKQEMGDLYVVEGIRFNLFITPEDRDDFDRYRRHFDQTFKDSTATKYCRNNRFEIRAIRLEGKELKWEYPSLQPL